MEKVTAFKASDGTLFCSIELCQEHEHSLIWTDRIREFMASKWNSYQGSAHASVARKAILAWERFKVDA
jgi:hypothetical protein